MARQPKKQVLDDSLDQILPLNGEQKRILAYLKKLRFKKRLLGGVRERDVWKKLEELNNLYHEALKAERVRYDALLEQRGFRDEGTGMGGGDGK